jgi:hypothetical protein
MEHTQIVARLLKKLAAARASINASYLLLWPAERRSPRDRRAGGSDGDGRVAEPQVNPWVRGVA